MDYLRIWADESGETHLDEVTLDRVVTPAEHGVSELWSSLATSVDRIQFLDVQAVDQVPAEHCAPRRQFVVFVDGWVAGKGHITELEPGVRRVLQIPLDS